MWAWPVSILMLGLWYATLKTTSFGVELRHAHPSWYGILAGLGLGLIGALGFRRGFKLVLLRPDRET